MADTYPAHTSTAAAAAWIQANTLDWIPSPDGDPNAGAGFYGTCCTEVGASAAVAAPDAVSGPALPAFPPFPLPCAQLDIWEANVVSTAVTPHMCTVSGQYRW